MPRPPLGGTLSNRVSFQSSESRSPIGKRIITGLFLGALCGLLLGKLGLLTLLPVFREVEWTIPAWMVFGGVLGTTRLRPLLYGIAGFATLLWLIVAYTPLTRRLIPPLVVAMPPAHADAVVVLSSRIYADEQFTDVGLSRLLHGLELMQAHYAPRLILTELPKPENVNARASEKLAAGLGIHCQIGSVGPVNDTHDEAVLIEKLAKEHHWKRILLVTSPTHSRRSTLLFRKHGFEVISSPSRELNFDIHNPAGADARCRAFDAYLHETVGMFIYRRRGWI